MIKKEDLFCEFIRFNYLNLLVPLHEAVLIYLQEEKKEKNSLQLAHLYRKAYWKFKVVQQKRTNMGIVNFLMSVRFYTYLIKIKMAYRSR